MKFLLTFLSLGCAVGIPMDRPDEGAEIEDTHLAPIEILKKYGYPAESHIVQTDDGYLLTLYRIPYGRLCSATKSRGPVFVQHGLLSSAVDWFVVGTKRGLPYILADNCYDVWLGNSRGTTYSTAHAYLDVKSSKYWNFSWHEMGVYDIPAITTYILHVTGKDDLFYIGHSQGTTQFFVFCSNYPAECEEKIRAAFMLAPIAFFEHTGNVMLSTIAKFIGAIEWIANTIGLDQFLPHNDFIAAIGGSVCSNLHPGLEKLCSAILFAGCGVDAEQVNQTMIPIYLGHMPAGAATKQLLHYAQLLNSGQFRQYDHGKTKNQEVYGQMQPPDYDLGVIFVPTHLIYSLNDLLAAVPDVENLSKKLGNLAGMHLVQFEKFDHLDFVIARDVVPLLYDPLLELMNDY